MTRQPSKGFGDRLSSPKLALDEATIDAIARRVVELFDGRAPGRADLVDAATLARLLGVSRGYVYEHADRLGAIRLGNGEKARPRFDVEKAKAAMASGSTDRRADAAQSRTASGKARKPKQSRSGRNAALLPIGSSATTDRKAT